MSAQSVLEMRDTRGEHCVLCMCLSVRDDGFRKGLRRALPGLETISWKLCPKVLEFGTWSLITSASLVLLGESTKCGYRFLCIWNLQV